MRLCESPRLDHNVWISGISHDLEATVQVSAGSRLLIQDDIYEEFTQKLDARTKQMKVGNSMAPGTEMGPLVSRQHMEKVRAGRNFRTGSCRAALQG